MSNGDDRFEGHDGDPGKDDRPDRKDPFDGRTYLYIRDHPFDDGTEPLPAGLTWYLSPDITVIKPDATSGGEAVANALNTVEVTVTNAGGITALDAYVDAFVSNPTTSFTPSGADPVGGGYLTIPGYGTASIGFPWTPTSSQAGHRCLAARVSLIIPPDTYLDGTVFDVRGDRHVAQRNITVVDLAGAKKMSFQFMIGNPAAEQAEFTLAAAEIRPRDEREIAAVRGALRCGAAQLADVPLGQMGLTLGRTARAEDPDPDDERDYLPEPQVRFGVLPKPAEGVGEEKLSVRLKGGETRPAIVTVERQDTRRPDDLNIVQVTQHGDGDTEIGGIWIALSG